MKLKILKAIAASAFAFAMLIANSTCIWATYQPKLPDSCAKLKKL